MQQPNAGRNGSFFSISQMNLFILVSLIEFYEFTLFSSLAFLKTDLIAEILPSIISDGAIMSAPAFAKDKEMAAIFAMLSSFSIRPVSSLTIPQWPSEV